ncbi:MAG: HAMP domain-containing sensor histidine kinase [Bacteroidota bacterium]
MSSAFSSQKLEIKIFNTACIVLVIIAVINFFLDFFISGSIVFIIQDIVLFLIFGSFYYLSKFKGVFKPLVIPFLVIVFISINVSWSVSGERLGIGYIYFFIVVLFSILVQNPARFTLMILFAADITILTAIQYYNPEFGAFYELGNRPVEIIAMSVCLGSLCLVSAYMIGYLKHNYEKERIKVKQTNEELLGKNHEIEAQNEELRMYQEQVVKQRDQIIGQAQELQKVNKNITATNEDLSSLVNQRTSELDLLFYRSSHDFRQPLTTLMGLCKVAEMSINDQQSKELFEKIDMTTARMDRMLRKFLMVYQINHYLPEQQENLDFEEMINTALEHTNFSEEVADLSMSKDMNKYARDDNRNFLIGIILNNLIENSISFKKYEKAKINIRFFDYDDKVYIIYEDDGLGIPVVHLDKIYEMFFRGSVLSAGNGLGLYVVKKAVEKLQGDISVKTEIDQYTRFEINFPL